MMLALHRSDDFVHDFDLQYQWYLDNASETVAERYYAAVMATLQSLVVQPSLGRRRNFRHPALRDLRSFRAEPPFDVHLVFYRHTVAELYAERIMHGARNLPHRLLEPPGSAAT